MGVFPAADQPGAGRERGQHAGVEMVGELDDSGAVTQAAVAVERGHPVGGDGDRDSDGELRVQAVFAQAAGVGEELVAATGRVGPDEDRAAVAVRVGNLVQGLVQDGDVVGGGVAAGVTRRGIPARVSPVASRKHSSGW